LRVQGVFDFVDADAAWVASYLHDVYRLSTALGVLAAGELGGQNTLPRYEAAVTFVCAYIEQLRLFDSQPDMKDVNAAQVTRTWQANTAPHSGWGLACGQLRRLKQPIQARSGQAGSCRWLHTQHTRRRYAYTGERGGCFAPWLVARRLCARHETAMRAFE